MDVIKLTVFFDEPFWVGHLERQDSSGYQVARHVFGAEPTDPELSQFVCGSWKRLRFTTPSALSPEDHPRISDDAHISFKRKLRMAKKEMQRSEGRGTKSQQALSAQYELDKAEHKADAKKRKEQEAEERFLQKQEKRKAKHRGH